MRHLLLVISICLGTAAHAQDESYDFSDWEDGRPELTRILDDYMQQCKDEADGTALIVRNEDTVLTEVDLDGDGERNDLVLDMGQVFCNYAMTLWAGTGGSPIHFIINGTSSQSWSGHKWDIERLGPYYPTVILIARHGSICDGAGAQPCVQAIVYDPDDKQFMTVRYPQSNEEPEDPETEN
jgi:hypothetical protein